ncbi:MAG: hypothetical protein R6V03_05150 [Kiritimatiellia bacterium]
MKNRPLCSPRLLYWGAAVLVSGVFLTAGLYRTATVSRTAVLNEAVCRQLLSGSTAGRQALVASVWHPPFPVLFRLPAAAATRGFPLSSLLVSAVFGAAALVLTERVLRKWGAGRIRYILLAAFALNPLFLKGCISGSVSPSAVFLTVLTAYGLSEWTRHRRLKGIIYMGLGIAGLAGVSFQMYGWLAAVAVMLAIDLTAGSYERGQREGVLVLTLFPPVYVLAVWVLGNWLVMGDPLYFIRSLTSGQLASQVRFASDDPVGAGYYLAGGLCAALALLCAVRSKQAPGFTALLAAAPVVSVLWMNARGILWGWEPVLASAGSMCVLALGHVSGGRAAGGKMAAVISAAAALGVVASLWLWGSAPSEAAGKDGPAGADLDWVTDLKRRVLTCSRHAAVFACGYDSLIFADKAKPDSVVIPSLDFDFDRVRTAYPGRRLYVLVPRPEGVNSAESVFRRHRRFYDRGGERTLAAGRWGDGWRLFEIIQAPRPLSSGPVSSP